MESKWKYLGYTGKYHYWESTDENNKPFYNVTSENFPPPNSSGGYYNLESLMVLKNDYSFQSLMQLIRE